MSSIRRISVIATGVFALGAACMASSAGIADKMLERVRDRGADNEQPTRSQPAPQAEQPRSQPAPRAEQPASPRSQPPAAQRVPESRQESRVGVSPRVAIAQPSAPSPAVQPQVNRVEPGNRSNVRNDSPRGNDNVRGNGNGNSRGVAGEILSRTPRTTPPPAAQPQVNRGVESGSGVSNPRNEGPRGNGNVRDNDRGVAGELLGRARRNGGGNGNGGGGDHGSHPHRPPHVVPSLPHGYRNYYWNGRPYYTFGGYWYEPYGGSYISIGVPYGLFVTSLPGYSSSFYYDNTRYYYYDDTYYVYEPARRGYVVTHSPYGDDEEDYDDYDDSVDEDMYIYPAQGQSEQQQADDRYACHRWAVDQTGYDPIDAEYDRDAHAKYVRAMTACLTGRGYTVR